MEDRYVLTEYVIPFDLPGNIKIGLVSDLHECEPDKALMLLKQGKPDLIMVAGDTFERHGAGEETHKGSDEGMWMKILRHGLMKMDGLFGYITEKRKYASEYAWRFLREAGQIAPVFLSLGNHEWYLLPEDRKVIKESGTMLLDNADCTAMVKGIELRVGGLSSDPDFRWLDRFCAKSGCKILLSHHPEYYERYLKDRNIHLILSGHGHGGQIRIGNRGIYAPGQGLFPKYTKGIYDGKMVVTAGGSNTASVPRWGNPCEVVMICLENGKKAVPEGQRAK